MRFPPSSTTNLSRTLRRVYDTLYTAYGPQSWWPADTPFEVMVGAILTQNTSWSNVEKAIAGLTEVCSMTPEDILSLPPELLQDAIRPSGYFRQKASRLRGFCAYLMDSYGGDEAGMADVPVGRLREDLLGIKGVGPETADSILLYALGTPVFVVDAYTRRLFSRLGLCAERETYEALQTLFMDNLDPDTEMFNEYHALIVKHSKHTCTKRNPQCENCPLINLCAWKFKIQNSKFKIEEQ